MLGNNVQLSLTAFAVYEKKKHCTTANKALAWKFSNCLLI